MLRGTDISGQPIGLICKVQKVQYEVDFLNFEDGSDRFPRNVGMELPLHAA
jgi:hypothetical protein